MAANHNIDLTKPMNEWNTAITDMDAANTDQNAKETAYHEAVIETGRGKDTVTKKASCLCDLVIGAYGRTTPRGRLRIRRGDLASLAGPPAERYDPVADAQDIDLAMITGAGWPFWLGGITPYLDRSGVSERATGQRFAAPGVATLPA